MVYNTADSRLAAFLVVRGHSLVGTDTRYQGEEDRVHLLFQIDEEELGQLKREFFESGEVPALEFANSMKAIMHAIREARELAREAR